MTGAAMVAAAFMAVAGIGPTVSDRFETDGKVTLVQKVREESPKPKPKERPKSEVDTTTPSETPIGRRSDGDDRESRLSQTRRAEILILGAVQDVALAEDEIRRISGDVLRHRVFGNLDLAMSVAEIGPLMTVPILRARLARKGIDVAVDRDAVYRQAGSSRSYARSMVGLPETGDCTLQRAVRIGLIDGPVDLTVVGAAGMSVTTRSILDAGEEPADSEHATSLAMLLAANGGGGSSAGIAPGGRIYAAEAFVRRGSTNVMPLDNMISALDWLLAERVELINLSLAGPRNQVLARAMQTASGRGILLVAAVGNDSRDDVAFPAADPHVISVTAVDARKRRYRSANMGREVDFAAPGVDLLIPGAGEARYRSGTSYAAAVVTGLLARELALAPADAGGVAQRLSERAEDLGRPGRDSEFGWGLAHSGGC
ncbi:MAG: S8 family serine peptidase [Albidovulum sp.]|uniref:S8 family serine peptidase n=1 Tax=Albidovulum sp. TaxID=1872424 RepID=UPI003CBE01FD